MRGVIRHLPGPAELVARGGRGQYSPMDAAAKKTVLRQFPYGLYVVTVAHGGEEHGMTANWVTQAAFEPPMVAVAVENTSRTIGMIRDAHHFAVNLLQQSQRELAGKLGRSDRKSVG